MTITWALLATGCLIAELLTGTLYLLVLCAAFAGATGIAALELSIPLQISAATLIAVIGAFLVRRWRTRSPKASALAAVEHPVASIVTADGPRYRVRWRGSEWNATGPAGLPEGSTVAITGQSGNTLHIAAE